MEKMSILIENLEFLTSHNKNYTKKQYYAILECLEIAKELEQKANLCKGGHTRHEHKRQVNKPDALKSPQ